MTDIDVEIPLTIDEQDEEVLEEGEFKTRFHEVLARTTKTVKKRSMTSSKKMDDCIVRFVILTL